MLTILNYAQGLVYTLMNLMPSEYQKNSLRALMGLFLEATGRSLPEHSQTVSASALSRFLNKYTWSTRAVIRAVRADIVAQILSDQRPRGRRPILEVVLDMTTLEKVGKFKGLGKLIRVYNGKRGLHLLVLYIMLGKRRLPWGFRVYRGQGELSHIELGQRLLSTLPKKLTQHFEIRILGDTAFGSIEMLKWVKTKKRTQGIFGIRSDRRLADGRHVYQILRRGQLVYLQGVDFPVTLSWYWVDRDDGTREKRFVVSTKPLSGVYITILGRRRWQIEGFFKVAKHRFSLHHFGQSTLLGVYRWLVLSMIAYLLAHLASLWSGMTTLTDWGEVSRLALSALFPTLVVLLLILEIKRVRPKARKLGLDITFTGWQYG